MQKTNTVMVLSGGCFSFWFDVVLVLSAALECTDPYLQLIISTHMLKLIVAGYFPIKSSRAAQFLVPHFSIRNVCAPVVFKSGGVLVATLNSATHLLYNLLAAPGRGMATDESFKLNDPECHPSLCHRGDQDVKCVSVNAK
mmetsp:Transcript_14129/g.25601  ORF Transcript_14129/g.25601 Transcript_14129/m.25601 type:complete len:141 (+) Transcript_14129:149-571(+)